MAIGLDPAAQAAIDASAARDGFARSRAWPALAAALALAGVASRLLDFAAPRSLWIDEAALADNILGRSAGQLFARLDYAQSAAPGFLLWAKLCCWLAGPGERALRLPALLSGCAALGLIFLLARRCMSGPGAAVACGLLAFGGLARAYAVELKPYSTDLMVMLAVAWAAHAVAVEGPSRGRLGALALLGAAAPWLSLTAPFALAGAAAALLLRALRGGGVREARPLLLALAAPALSQLGALALSLHNASPDDLRYLRDFFAPAFLPLGKGALEWLPDALDSLVQLAVGKLYPRTAELLAVAGLLLLARRDRGLLALVLAPVAAALAVSAARLYPFTGRLILALVPAAILPLAFTVDRLCLLARWRWPARAVALALSLALLVPLAQDLGAAAHPREELGPALELLRPKLRADDLVYVYYGGLRAFTYYSEHRQLAPAAQVQRGSCARSEPRRYRDEIAALRGPRRVWLLLTHAFSGMGVDERALFEAAFARRGPQLERFETDGVLVALYQVGADAGGLEELPLPPSTDHAQQTRVCYGTLAP